MIRFAVFASIIGTCAFFAAIQDTQRKIQQESDTGLYAVNLCYNMNRPTIRNDSAFMKVNQEIVAQFDRQLPLATIK